MKGMGMARYIYNCYGKKGCIGYFESTPEEDSLDMVDGQMVVGFTGAGYLAFWKRCKEFERACNGKRERSLITDLYTGEEKVW